MIKVYRIPIHLDEQLQLPSEAINALGKIEEAFLVIDAAQQKVTLTALDPEIVENEAILDEIAKLQEDISLEDYGAPVPESFLKRRGKGVNQQESK